MRDVFIRDRLEGGGFAIPTLVSTAYSLAAFIDWM